MSSSDDAKQDLLKLARILYSDHELELRRINKLDRTYEASEALKWYSSDSFAYRLLNRAIRSENIDLLFACQFFTVDLHRQLDTLHKPYIELIRSRDLAERTVYHGQQMTPDDLAKLKLNIGKLISTNSSLSTSTDREIVLVYAGDATVHLGMVAVLFQIIINLCETSDEYQHPFADITAFSPFREEHGILFLLAAMFRIESVIEQPDNIWLVNMVFVKGTTEIEEMCQLSAYLNINQDHTTSMADLANILSLMRHDNRAVSFCQKLLHEIPGNWRLAVRCHTIMGDVYRNRHPELALQSFENAPELQLQYNPTNFQALAILYNGIGLAHRHLESGKQLLVHYCEKALQMCTSVSDENQIEWCLVATIANNLTLAEQTRSQSGIRTRKVPPIEEAILGFDSLIDLCCK